MKKAGILLIIFSAVLLVGAFAVYHFRDNPGESTDAECSDGMDNDSDWKIDCDDRSCFMTIVCQ